MDQWTTALKVSGTGEVDDNSPDIGVISPPGVGKSIYLQKGVIMVTVAAVGGGGEVSLEDGFDGPKIFESDADAVRVIPFDFGSPGYPLTPNTRLNLKVSGAGTTQATARATATGIVMLSQSTSSVGLG